MREGPEVVDQPTFTRRAFLKRIALGGFTVVTVGAGFLAVCRQESQSQQLISEFDIITNRLKASSLPTQILGLTDQEGNGFRQGDRWYGLIRNLDANAEPRRVLETVFYHGTGVDAPSDPPIEYWIGPDGVKSNRRWWGRGTGRDPIRADESTLSDAQIALLSRQLREDFDSWSA